MTYETDLIQLLSIDIPEEKIREIGFLEISGIAHYENVNSRIYAYFLDQRNYPLLAELFINSLIDIVFEKTGKKIEIGNYNVNTEELTKKGNRIDITIQNKSTRNAILIENKIYHYLNNDLLEYWTHFGYPDNQQIGVLLTLNKHEIPLINKNQFVNITHLEWTSRIKNSGLPHGLPDKIYTYLNDFFRTITYLTKTSHMNEQARFYFEHASKVIKAKQTYEEANSFLLDQMNILASKIGWKLYGNELGIRDIWDENNKCDTFYSINYKPLLDGKLKVIIYIKMIREDQKKANMDESILKNEIIENQIIEHNLIKGENFRENLEFVYKEYELTLDELTCLADTLYQKIDSDFQSLMSEIFKSFYSKIILVSQDFLDTES